MFFPMISGEGAFYAMERIGLIVFLSPGLATAGNLLRFGASRTVIAGSGGRRHGGAADRHRAAKEL